MRLVLLTVLLLLLAAPAADAKSRLLAQANGTVTIEWPERVCTPDGVESEPITFSLQDLDFDSPAVTETPIDEVELDESETDPVLVDDYDWPAFPVKPWRVVYRDSGAYHASYDLTCADAAGDVAVDPIDPDARTIMRAARASHRAKVKAVRAKARRRGPRSLGQASGL